MAARHFRIGNSEVDSHKKKFGLPSGKPNSLLYVDGANPVSHILNGLIRERNVREDPLLDPS